MEGEANTRTQQCSKHGEVELTVENNNEETETLLNADTEDDLEPEVKVINCTFLIQNLVPDHNS